MTKLPTWTPIFVIAAMLMSIRIPVVEKDVPRDSHEIWLTQAYETCSLDSDLLPKDECDQIIEEYSEHHSKEWTWAFVWELGRQRKGSYLAVEWIKYVMELSGTLLVTAVVGGILESKGLLTPIQKRYFWLPAAFYLVLAFLRLFLVPCTWTTRTGFRVNQATEHAGTIAVWRIGTESPRYSLIFFEEFLLLECVATCYGVLFALYPKHRPWRTRRESNF